MFYRINKISRDSTRSTARDILYRLWQVGVDNEIYIVTLRRGIRDIDSCTYTQCPDVRVYRCLTSLRVAMLRVVGISKGVQQW